jgi:hypothetical protein
MSQKEANQVNKVIRFIICAIGAAITVAALCYNIGHLITAVIVIAFGLEADFITAEDIDNLDLR